MSNLTSAVCSFCSREDSSVKVVCSNYCLICRRCQLLPATRQIILEHSRLNAPPSQHDANGIHSSNQTNYDIFPLEPNDLVSEKSTDVIKGYCPICSSPMSKNMYVVVRNLMDEKEDQDLNLLADLDLGYKSNPLVDFLLSFRSTYGSIGNEINLQAELQVESTGTRPSTAQDAVNTADTIENKISAMYESKKVPSNVPIQIHLSAKLEGIDSLKSPTQTAQNKSQENDIKPIPQTGVNRSKLKTPSNDKLRPNSRAAAATTSKDNKVDIYAAVPPTLTNHEGLAIFSECMVLIWQSTIRGCDDSLLSTLKKILLRKKATNRGNDFRLKSFIDYIVQSNGLQLIHMNVPGNVNKSAYTLLMGKLLGISPKVYDTVRPVLSSITTLFHVLCFCGERAIATKNKEIYDTVRGSPSTNELKSKMDKLSAIRLVPVRKALQIIEYLIAIEEPHWCMTPLTATCVTTGGKSVWESESVCKLIHLIMYCIQGDETIPNQAQGVVAQGNKPNTGHNHNKAGRRDSNHMHTGDNIDETGLLSNVANPRIFNAGKRALSIVSSSSNHIPANPINPSTTPATTILKRLQQLPNKAKEFWNSSIFDTWKDSVDSKSLGCIVYSNASSKGSLASPTNRKTIPSSNDSLTNCTSLSSSIGSSAGYRGRAALPYNGLNVNISSPFSNVQTVSSKNWGTNHPKSPKTDSCSQSNQSQGLMNTQYYKAAKYFAKSCGKGVISSIDLTKALTIIPADMMVTPAELSLICIAAWEAEYDLMVQMQASSALINNRRPAIKGTFDKLHAKLNFPDRLVMKRIISWYNTIYLPNQRRSQMNGLDDWKQLNDSNRSNGSDDDSDTDSDDSHDNIQSKMSLLSNSQSVFQESKILSQETAIDWILIKELAKERILPFSVPESIMMKSPAELQYHFLQILRDEEARKELEDKEEEEEWNTFGPYDTLPYRLSGTNLLQNGLKSVNSMNDMNNLNELEDIGAISHGRVMMKRVEISVSPSKKGDGPSQANLVPVSSDLIEDLQRQKYLSSQTIGIDMNQSFSRKNLKTPERSMGLSSSFRLGHGNSLQNISRLPSLDENRFNELKSSKNTNQSSSRSSKEMKDVRFLGFESPTHRAASSSSSRGSPSKRRARTPSKGNGLVSPIHNARDEDTRLSPQHSSLLLQEQHLYRSFRSSPSNDSFIEPNEEVSITELSLKSPNKSTVGTAIDMARNLTPRSSHRVDLLSPKGMYPRTIKSNDKDPLDNAIKSADIPDKQIVMPRRTFVQYTQTNPFESSLSVSTDPLRSHAIPGSRGRMFPSSSFEASKESSIKITIADLLSIHPNLLTKAQLIVPNDLMIDEAHGGLKYGNIPSLTDILLDETDLNNQSKKFHKIFDIIKETNAKQSQSMAAVNESKESLDYNRIVLNHKKKLNYSATEQGFPISSHRSNNLPPRMANQSDEANIFYKPIKMASCPPVNYNKLNPHPKKDRRLNSLAADQLSLFTGSMSSMTVSPQSATIQSQANANGVMISPLTMKHFDFSTENNPLNRESMYSFPLHGADQDNLNHRTDSSLSITSSQYFESFALEFTEYMRELQSKVQVVRQDKANTLSRSQSSYHQGRPTHRLVTDASTIDKIKYKMTMDSFILNYACISIPYELSYILENFFNKHVKNLRLLHFEGLNLGYQGALLLQDSKLHEAMSLQELNIAHNNLGDRGVIAITNALNETSRGQLKGLVLNHNDIALANDGLKILASFTSLTYLDMSYNRISLDVKKQQDLFQNIFTCLNQLKYLSLSHNTLQDKGIEQLVSIINQDYLLDLEVLDISKCSITAKSIPAIQSVVDNPKLERFKVLVMIQHMLTHDQIVNLKYPNRLTRRTGNSSQNKAINPTLLPIKQGNESNAKAISSSSVPTSQVNSPVPSATPVPIVNTISTVTSNTEGYLVMFSEPHHKLVRVVLEGEYYGIDFYINTTV